MPQERGPDRREGRTYTNPLGLCATRSLAPGTQREGALLPQHSQPPCPEGRANPTRFGYAPRPSGPGPVTRGALLPRHPQHQGFRPLTTTGSTFGADRPRVDETTQQRAGRR